MTGWMHGSGRDERKRDIYRLGRFIQTPDAGTVGSQDASVHQQVLHFIPVREGNLLCPKNSTSTPCGRASA